MILAVQKVKFLLYFLQKMLVGLFQYLLLKAEFGMDGDVYFTDGPAVYRQQNGKLLILWYQLGA